MSSLEAVVRALRRSDARSSAGPFVVHALLGATIWVAAVQIMARLVPIERRLQLATLGIPVVLGIAATAWLARRPRPDVLMRLADLRLGLQERLSTAWERRAASGAMDELLRRDALQHAQLDRLHKAFPVRIDRREAGAIVILIAGALALAVLPNSMDRVLAQRQADSASQARAANTIHAAQNRIAASPKSAPVDPKVQRILSDAQTKIKDAPDPRQALAAISPAEQQLQQLTDPQTPARTSTAENLAAALSTTTAGKAAGQALSSSPAKGAQAVRDLASQLQSLSPQERVQLAKALADAAQHAQDPAMAAQLNRASAALASGDFVVASAALNDLAGQLDSLQDQQSNNQEVATAINSLETAREELAAQANSDASASSANASAGALPSAAASGGAGTGNGTGNGAGNGNANGNGNGSGSGGTGGTGANGSGSGSGSAAKPSESLYVPGQPVPGELVNDPTPLGPGQNVPLTPYMQVLQAYQQAALDATNHTLIPGSERDLVREYFSALGEPPTGQ
jgi:hypothetical protein